MAWRAAACVAVYGGSVCALAQVSGSLANSLTAAATAQGGSVVTESGSPIDAVVGNPAGLTGVRSRVLDVSLIGALASGSFDNAANSNARLRGVAGALPFGAFAAPLAGHGGASKWTGAAAFTPEVLMRANWHYFDAPGTAGTSYGFQRQETQIVAFRGVAGFARTLGPRWSLGATLGLVYNRNELNAPYIFQEQPALKGLKVLLALKTQGIGWNGGAGAQWQPNSHMRVGLAWKSGTSIHTHGDANGTASALFTALGVAADPVFAYQAHVENHLPQAFDAGLSWQTRRHITFKVEGDFVAWGQAFQQLPVRLTGGTNATINSVAGSSTVTDAVPLHWNNQGGFHAGVDVPVRERWTVRGGYGYVSNPVPSATLTPLTAAIMQNTLALGGGWSHARWRWDAAYQVQLPATGRVVKSALQAGEYDNSSVKVAIQSVTVTGRYSF